MYIKVRIKIAWDYRTQYKSKSVSETGLASLVQLLSLEIVMMRDSHCFDTALPGYRTDVTELPFPSSSLLVSDSQTPSNFFLVPLLKTYTTIWRYMVGGILWGASFAKTFVSLELLKSWQRRRRGRSCCFQSLLFYIHPVSRVLGFEISNPGPFVQENVPAFEHSEIFEEFLLISSISRALEIVPRKHVFTQRNFS